MSIIPAKIRSSPSHLAISPASDIMDLINIIREVRSMNFFTYYSPTRVIFGAKTTDQAGAAVKAHGGTNVLVLYGGGSALRNGVLDRVTKSLEAAGLSYECVGGIQPNPRLSFAQKLVDKYQGKGFDFLLAVGGGSVIDTMKGVSMGLACGSPIWDFYEGKRTLTAAIPMGSVLTIAAAGSETSASSVLTNEETGVKRGVNTDFNRPLFAIMDPELTYTLPAYQTACGVTDIMMHTLDRYFSDSDTDYLTDAIGEAILRDVMDAGLLALADRSNYSARSEIMWCGSLSHNDLTGLGHGRDFSVHQLGHELSAKFDIAHGASLAIMWPAWARYCCAAGPRRFAELGRRVLHITEQNDEIAAQLTINGFEAYWQRIGMPVRFSEAPEIGILSEETLNELARRCSYYDTRVVGFFRPIGTADMLEIYRAANR